MVLEQHLVIDWANHFPSEHVREIVDLIEGLKVKTVIPMSPLKNKGEVMSRFYGQSVNDFRGETNFTIYLVSDSSPFYEKRKTSKGLRKVNTKMFDLKRFLRKETGGYRVHTTDNIQETKDNLRVLGLSDYYNQRKFKDLREVFETLNSCKGLSYLVMRNFEGFPDKVLLDGHLDVDLLTNDYYLVKALLDGDSVIRGNRLEDGGFRILNNVLIGGVKIWFDIRFLGDDYYCRSFQEDLLSSRVLKDGFFVPNERLHLLSLLYHAVIHKARVAPNYKKYFTAKGLDGTKEELKLLMNEAGYHFVRPSDSSVGYFYD